MGKKLVNFKKSLLAAILFITVASLFYSQNTENPQVNSDVSVTAVEEVDNYFADDTTTDNSSSDYKAPSTVWTFFKMFIFLALVVAAIYFVMNFFKKKTNLSKSDDDFMRRVCTLNLAPGKSVEIVTLLEHAYILGVTDGSINLLGELDDLELIQALNLNFDKKQNVKKPMSFSDVLDIFMPNGPRSNTNIYADTESKINNLNKQRDSE